MISPIVQGQTTIIVQVETKVAPIDDVPKMELTAGMIDGLVDSVELTVNHRAADLDALARRQDAVVSAPRA
jgi:hypothetical protein